MDHTKSQKIAALNQIIRAHYLVKLTQLLISLSVCSFIFTPSSLLAFLHYFNSLPLQLFTHNIDKNCMFLFCNGLLVFVGIIRSFSGSSGDDEPSKYIEDGSQSKFSDVEANEPMLEKESDVKTIESDEQNTATEQAMEFKYMEEEQQEEEDIEKAIVEYEDQSGESSGTISIEEEKEPEEERGTADAGSAEERREAETDELLIEENVQEDEAEEEEEAEAENWTLSTDEMNKKFDDFIRRMKEDLRIEARRQLVMV